MPAAIPIISAVIPALLAGGQRSANQNAADKATGAAQQSTGAAQRHAMAALQAFLAANPNPASHWGGIQGPDNSGRPSSVGSLANPIGQTPGPAGQTPGIAPGGGGGPTPGAVPGNMPMRFGGGGQGQGQGQVPPGLIQLLSQMRQGGQGMQGGQPPVQHQLPPIQLPHPGPIIRMGEQR